MRLKSVEIHGFKSFYDRVTLSFPPGITTIVGPNGCGKSNILDAILWAIGERSARHLRGKVMEDVIFAGADGIKPLGMAEVSLILSNDDGHCPERYREFGEIMISRRLFRSGESEYLINKTPCRLRDVVDLFLDMGVSNQAYSIIEQGRIEAIISAKPEERRVLIEEAAGIAKFRERKREALAKMELTEQNLLRIQDMTGEIRRQIHALERQVKRAERFKSLRKEIRQAELMLAYAQYHQLIDQQAQSDEVLGDLKKQEETLSAQLEKSEKALRTLRNRCAEWEERINTTERAIYEIRGLIDREEGRIEAGHRERASQKALEIQYGQEIDELNAKLQAAKKERSILQEEHRSLGQRISQKEKELESKEAEWQAMQTRWDEAIHHLEDQKADFVELLSQQSERKNQVTFCERTLKELRERKERNDQEIHEVEKTLKKNESLRSGKEALGRSLQTKLVRCEDKAGALRKEIASQEQNLAEMESLRAAVEEEYQVALSRLRSLEELQKGFEGFDEGVKAIILSSEATGAGIQGVVADILEPEPSYEVAVGAVLAHHLQYVIVQSLTAGLEALGLARQRGKGRIGVIPMNVKGREDRSPSPLERRKGVMGPLASHVRFRAGYEHLGALLLRDVWVVQDLDCAVQIWKEGCPFRSLVTPEGEVMDASGILVGGSPEGQAFQILKRRNEIKDLACKVKKGKARLEDVREKLKRARHKLAQLRLRLEAREKEKQALTLERMAVERDIERLAEEAKDHEKRHRVLIFEGDQLAAQVCDVESESLESRRQLEILGKGIEVKRNAIEKAKAELEAWEKQKASIDGERTRFQVEIVQWREQRRGTERNLDSLEKQERELRKQTSRRLELLENNRRAMQRTEQDILEAQATLSDRKKKQEEMSGRLSLEKQALKEKYRDLQELEEANRRDQTRLEELRKRVHEKNLELAETHLNVNHVVESVLDRYRIDIRVSPEPEEVRTREVPDQAELARLKASLDSLGEVNLVALQEYEDLKSRFDFLLEQQEDLKTSLDRLRKAVQRIDRTTKKRFLEAFEGTNERFQALFPRLFNGGKAALAMTNEDDILNTGIEILVQLPGKRLQRLDLLSGGEKALVAIALVFAFFLYRPTPFCLLDEVDASLDDANVSKFLRMVQELAHHSQLIFITHNKKTMEVAQTLYGITMETPGISKVVSVRLQHADPGSPVERGQQQNVSARA